MSDRSDIEWTDYAWGVITAAAPRSAKDAGDDWPSRTAGPVRLFRRGSMDEIDLLGKLRRCAGCAVLPGDEHQGDCPLAICQATGEFRILHDGERDELMRMIAALPEAGVDDHDCGSDVWSGERPGSADCRRLGWYVRRATPEDQPLTGWIPCSADTPGAALDFYRLWTDAQWRPTERRWVQSADAGR